MSPGDVQILVSTYNGAAFLEQQLDSLLRQTYQNWQLLIRDDGSTDRTLKIIKTYVERYPGKILHVEDAHGNLGPGQSFAVLLSQAQASYIMFCDQDDVWLPDKIEISRNKMIELENIYGRTSPILVHSDLMVVNESLNVVSTSMWQFQQNNPYIARRFNRSLMQNAVTGCTVLINKSLKGFATPIPKQAAMHDWWLALVAVAFGQVGIIEKATVLYRQHSKNEIGAQGWTGKHLLYKAMHFWQVEALQASLLKVEKQAEAFAKQYGHMLSPMNRKATYHLATLSHQNALSKRVNILRYRTLKTGFFRNLGLLLRA